MDSTVSVSKGVFFFPNGFNNIKESKKKSKRNLFESLFINEPWYSTFRHNWEQIETQIKELHKNTYSVLVNDIVDYVKSLEHNQNNSQEGIIPSATLLTGVNQPDHVNQFKTLVNIIREEVSPHVSIINSQDAQTLKNLVENAVWQLIKGQDVLDNSLDSDEFDYKPKLKKSHCTMRSLHKWYKAKYTNLSIKKSKHLKKTLVIILPDFESFNTNILQDFVMILSSYTTLPIVLIFGVATSVSALHKSFPYHVSSKLFIKVFHSHPSHVYMNQVLENIFLTHTSSFHLSGKAFELLTDVFLFYDFSVTGLIQSIKYCMMEHYYGDNIKSLCCSGDTIESAINNLTADDLEGIRQLLSFRPFLEVQDCQTKIALFEDDNFFREVLFKEMNKLHDYLHSFYLCVRLLSTFVKDLPKNVFGKTVREIYTKCSMDHITSTPPFKECMQLINFQSQLKLVDNIKNALKEINSVLKIVSPAQPLRATPVKNNIHVPVNNDLGLDFAKTIRIHMMTFLRQIENASCEATGTREQEDGPDNVEEENVPGNRYKLKEISSLKSNFQKLLRATRVDKIQSEFEMIRSRFVSYLEEIFTKGLVPPHKQTFYEIVFFGDVSGVRKQIVGSPRGALHTALSNPAHYLQVSHDIHERLRFTCSCCVLESAAAIAGSMPDLCVAYKLHTECGKHINMYDWLQAFTTVLQAEQQHTNTQVRFGRAVCELQFLGFIKSSKRKTDHVMRLTC